jgi:hypothetical protein
VGGLGSGGAATPSSATTPGAGKLRTPVQHPGSVKQEGRQVGRKRAVAVQLKL